MQIGLTRRKSRVVKALGQIFFWFGLGLLVHDYAHDLWVLGGYGEILSPQGGWIGLALLILGWFLQRSTAKPGSAKTKKRKEER